MTIESVPHPYVEYTYDPVDAVGRLLIKGAAFNWIILV